MSKKADWAGRPPLEPLPLTDAERQFIALRLHKHRRALQAKQDRLQAHLDATNPALELFGVLLVRLERITYGIAMCEVIAERLELDLDDPHLLADPEDGYRPDH